MMFAGIIHQGSPEQEILLATRMGTKIDNGIAGACIPGNALEWEAWKANHPNWTQRKPACGIYNCFGMVFASRRTCVYLHNLVELILEEDRFKKIALNLVRHDDVVIYRAASGEIVHAGRIIKADQMGGVWLFKVLSKWGAKLGESIHAIDDVPNNIQADLALTEYWTDRTDHEIAH